MIRPGKGGYHQSGPPVTASRASSLIADRRGGGGRVALIADWSGSLIADKRGVLLIAESWKVSLMGLIDEGSLIALMKGSCSDS